MSMESRPPEDGFGSAYTEQIEVASLFIDDDPDKRMEAIDRLDYMPDEERLRYMLESLTTLGRTATMLLAEQLGIEIEDVRQYIIDRAHDQASRDTKDFLD
jgi:hypothetical protein